MPKPTKICQLYPGACYIQRYGRTLTRVETRKSSTSFYSLTTDRSTHLTATWWPSRGCMRTSRSYISAGTSYATTPWRSSSSTARRCSWLSRTPRWDIFHQPQISGSTPVVGLTFGWEPSWILQIPHRIHAKIGYSRNPTSFFSYIASWAHSIAFVYFYLSILKRWQFFWPTFVNITLICHHFLLLCPNPILPQNPFTWDPKHYGDRKMSQQLGRQFPNKRTCPRN